LLTVAKYLKDYSFLANVNVSSRSLKTN